MKLKYKKDYLSITRFNDIELPEFVVLTGLNGTGKSHLLNSIRTGNAVIENINLREIKEFSNISFFLDKEMKTSLSKLGEHKKQLYSTLKNSIEKNANPYKNQLNSYLDRLINYCQDNKISFYELNENDFNNIGITNIFKTYDSYVNYIDQRLKTPLGNTNSQIVSDLSKLKKFTYKPLENLTYEELEEVYKPYSYKNDFLITQLGRIFSEYWQKKDDNDYNIYRNKTYAEGNNVLSGEEFENLYGKKPWDLINNILDSFSSLNYKVNNPEGLNRDSEFQLELIDINNPDIVIGFENLSSGERTMMALVSSIYKSIIDKNFPKLLLLDEIDASLHPSMSRIMLKVIQEEFVNKNNIKVILVTHSPSTVALAPENSVYVMKKNGEDRIMKSSNKEALNILTEGFASLTNDETNLKVSYNISKSSSYVLLTEGITDKIILEAAWNTLEKSKPNFDIQDCFDASFMRNLFNRKEIFINYPEKTFVAIFDFDKEGYEAFNSFKDYNLVMNDPNKGLLKKSKMHNAYVMLLPVPENDIKKQVIKSGNTTFENQSHMPIELLFHDIEKVQDKFIVESQVGGGSLIKFSGDKVSFASKIKQEFTDEDFKNIKPIFKTLKSIFNDD